MSQQSLFETSHHVTRLPLSEADVCYINNFLPEHSKVFTQLKEQLAWQQDILPMFGKKIPAPRLSAWYGDKNANYGYSGIRLNRNDWLPILSHCKKTIEEYSGFTFNSVLANYYRDGNDSVGWHSDDETELGINPVIASLSFGDSRRFSFKPKSKLSTHKPYHIDLQAGSLLLMSGSTQHHWLHQLAKTKEESKQGRINLTFRLVVS